jgi:hypothetical protein
MDGIFTEARKDVHLDCFVVTSEYSCKSISERDHGTVEYAVGGGDCVSGYDGVLGIAPDYI